MVHSLMNPANELEQRTNHPILSSDAKVYANTKTVKKRESIGAFPCNVHQHRAPPSLDSLSPQNLVARAVVPASIANKGIIRVCIQLTANR